MILKAFFIAAIFLFAGICRAAEYSVGAGFCDLFYPREIRDNAEVVADYPNCNHIEFAGETATSIALDSWYRAGLSLTFAMEQYSKNMGKYEPTSTLIISAAFIDFERYFAPGCEGFFFGAGAGASLAHFENMNHIFDYTEFAAAFRAKAGWTLKTSKNFRLKLHVSASANSNEHYWTMLGISFVYKD